VWDEPSWHPTLADPQFLELSVPNHDDSCNTATTVFTTQYMT
jgi:hypothetical protein